MAVSRSLRINPPIKWADVPGFPGYRASDSGAVQTCVAFKGAGYGRKPTVFLSETWRDLKFDADARGRKRVTLRREGRSHKFRVSRLILMCFTGPCPDGMEACHNNGDETDDRLENLRWDTHSSNLLDRRAHGTSVQGEMVHTAKLTADDVLEIRRVGYPLKQHAVRYGVTTALVCAILKRKVWKHV